MGLVSQLFRRGLLCGCGRRHDLDAGRGGALSRCLGGEFSETFLGVALFHGLGGGLRCFRRRLLLALGGGLLAFRLGRWLGGRISRLVRGSRTAR